MTYENTTKTQSSHILKVRQPDQSYEWLLFTLNRKLFQCDDIGGKPCVADKMEIEVRTIGSLTRGIKSGNLVMEMKGEARQGDIINFSNGYIVVENPWKGLRIGTYMMDYLVSWAIELYPHYQFANIKLSANDAIAENIERRYRFYKQFGFEFDWTGTIYEEGISKSSLRISDLNSSTKWKGNIEVISILDMMEDILSEAHRSRAAAIDTERQIVLDQARRNMALLARSTKARIKAWMIIALILGMVVGKQIF